MKASRSPSRLNRHFILRMPKARLRAGIGAILGLVLGLAAGGAAAATDTANWNPGTGNWNTAANWSGGVVPNNGGGHTYEVHIDNGVTGTDSVVTLDTNASINRLAIDAGDRLEMANNRDLTLVQDAGDVGSGRISNDGVLWMDSSGGLTDLRFTGDLTLGGSGALEMSDNFNNRIFGNTGTYTLTQEGTHEIQGSGQIFSLHLNNQGLIEANQTTELKIDITGSRDDLNGINAGTLQASNGATLHVYGSGITNTSGNLQALGNNSRVWLDNSRVNGGSLTGDGSIRLSNNSVLKNVTSDTTLFQQNSDDAHLEGTFANDGVYQLQSSGGVTDLRLDGDVTLQGNGTLEMSNNINNRILGNVNTNTLIQGADHGIHGSGQLTGLHLNNQGLIDANQTVELKIDLTGTKDSLTGTNTGTLQASNGATLHVYSSGIANAGGTLQALAGSQVWLDDSRVNEGTLSGAGSMRLSGDSVLNNVTSDTTLFQQNSDDARLEGTFTNNGTYQLQSTSGLTDLRLVGDVTLEGNGTLEMSNNINNRILGNVNANTLIQGADHGIHGSGQLTGLHLNNQGLIEANQATELKINLTGTKDDLTGINAGTLQASNGATLHIYSSGFINTHGTLRALAGSQVWLDGSRVNDGVLTGAGSMRLSGNSVLNNVASDTTLFQQNSDDARLEGTFTNNGTYQLQSTSGLTDLRLVGDVTLEGNGTLEMSDSGANRIFGSVATDTLIQAATHEIHGSGQLGNGGLHLNNRGLIEANQTTELKIDLTGSKDDLAGTNTGTLQASNGATLHIFGSGITNTHGTLRALAGSQVWLDGSRVNDGVLTGAGSMRLSGNSVLNNVASDTTLFQQNSDDARLEGTFTNNGTYQLQSTSGLTDLRFVGNVALQGNGALEMSNHANNRILGNATTDVLTQGAAHTIRGAGQLLANVGGMVNQGRVIADQATALTVNPGGGMNFDNQGTVEARDGGTLTFTSANEVANVAGNTLNGGTWNVIQGTGLGATLNLGTGGSQADITTNNATILLSGNGAVFNGIANLDTNQGSFTVHEGQIFNTAGALANSGTLAITDPFFITAINVNGDYTQTAGTTTLSGRFAVLDAGSNRIDIQGGTLAGTGQVNAAGGVHIGNGALVTPGHSPGILNVTGPFTLASGATWVEEIQGTDPGTPDFDQIQVTGSAALEAGSTIDIDLLGGYDPAVGSHYDIMTATGGITAPADVNGLLKDAELGNYKYLHGSLEAGDTILRLRTNSHIIKAIWDGGIGSYTASNWTWDPNAPVAATFPSNDGTDFFNVYVDDAKAGNSQVSLDTNASIDSLHVDAGDELDLGSGRMLTIVKAADRGGSGQVVNAGTLALQAAGTHSAQLILDGDVTLSGGGDLTLTGDSSLNKIWGWNGTERLTNVDNTLSGAGQIGVNLMSLTNQGSIVADGAQALVIDPNADGVINTGTLRATAGATLKLQNGAFTNAGGLIEAQAGSTVQVTNATLTGGNVSVTANGRVELDGAAVTGGTLDNSATGIVRTTGGASTLGGTVNNLAGGQIQVGNGTNLTLQGSGTYNNSGTLALQAAGTHSAQLILDGDVTLSGGGDLTLTGDSSLNKIWGWNGTERLTNVDNTLSGAGQIGVNLMSLTNQGSIVADGAEALVIDPNADGVINTGTLRATAGATLNLQDGTFTNTGGQIEAQAGSTVQVTNATLTGGDVSVTGNGRLELNGGTVTGGTLANSATGIVRTTGGTSTLGGTVNNLAGGQIQVGNGTNLTLQGSGTYNNAGTLALQAAGTHSAQLILDGDVTLSGGGDLTLTGDSSLNKIWGWNGTERLTNVDNTLSGAGQIGVNLMSLTNQGSIVADGAQALVIDPNADGVINTGTLRATAGATLKLQSGAFTNAGGLIEAQDASTVALDGVTVIGGTLNTAGTGVVRNTGTATLDGLTNAGSFAQNNGTTTTLKGTIDNRGSMAMQGITSTTDLRLDGDVTLSGGGTLTLTGDSSVNRIHGHYGGERLTNVDNRISGAGQIGVDFMSLTNQGTIVADGTQALTIDPNIDGVLNQGTLRATGTGGMQITGGLFDNQGTVEAVANGNDAFFGFTNTAIMQDFDGAGTLTGGTWRAVSDGHVAMIGIDNAPGGLTHIGDGATVTLSGTKALIGVNLAFLGNQLTANSGTLNIEAGQQFQVTSGPVFDNHGDVNISGAGSRMDALAVYQQDQGTTTLDEGTLGAAGVVDIQGGQLRGNGTLDSDLTVGAGGTVSPGFSPGLLTVSGDFDLGGAWLAELAGTDPAVPEFDRIQVGGIATLNAGATIDVDLLGGFAPVLNDHFDILNAATITDNTGNLNGIFDFSGATLGAGLSWQVQLIDDVTDTLRLLVTTSGTSGVIDATWSPAGAGDYSDAGQWAFSDTPVSATIPSNDADNRFNVHIDGGDTTDSVVNLDTSPSIDSLTLDAGDRLDIGGNNALTLVRNAGNAASGRLNNDGEVVLADSGTQSILLDGDVTFSGSGVVDLGDNFFGNTILANNAGDRLTNEAGHTIRGGGFIGAGQLDLTNRGTIEASATNALSIIPGSGAFTNEGTLKVDAGSEMDLWGAGSIHVTNAAAADIQVGDSGTLNVVGDLDNSGTLVLAGGTLNTDTLTNQAVGEVSGHGTLTVTGGGQMLNHGTVRAAGGTLEVTEGILGGSGTVQIDPGASLDLSAASADSNADYLIHNGDDLNLGSHDFRVDVDYQNANFGSGNAFDPRAHVTGTGQIVAGGSGVGQSITGDVSNGGNATVTLDFGELHVGASADRNYQVRNDSTDVLLRGAIQTNVNGGNISDGRLSGTGVAAGDFGPLAANGGLSGVRTVHFDASSAGALSGQVVHVINDFANVQEQDIEIHGAAFNLAEAQIQNGAPVVVGNFHRGDATALIDIQVQNSAPVSALYTERLDGQAAGADAGIVVSGPGFSGLVAGAGNNPAGSLQVGIDTGSAGAKSGQARFAFQSNGNGINGLGITALAQQGIQVQGNVYELAQGNATPVLNFAARRVGDAADSQTLSLSNLAADTGGFTETLTANLDAAPFNYEVNGSAAAQQVSGIAAASTSDQVVKLRTDTAGDYTGKTLNVGFVSHEVGGSGLGDTALTGTTVTLNGKVYAPAVADVQTTTVHFGVVRKGDVVAAQKIIVANTASGNLTDVLKGQFNSVDAPFTASGDLGAGLTAGHTDDSSLEVGLNTANAGVFNGQAVLGLASHNDDMTDLGLAAAAIVLEGQVNALAEPRFSLVSGSGSLGGGGTLFTLDFGTLYEGSTGLRQANLDLLNPGTAPAQDDLTGSFFGKDTGGGLFDFLNFNAFADLAVNGALHDLLVTFDPAGLGLGDYSGEIWLDPTSTYTGLAPYALTDVRLRVTARIVKQGSSVPEPSTLTLFLFLGIILILAHRTRHAER